MGFHELFRKELAPGMLSHGERARARGPRLPGTLRSSLRRYPLSRGAVRTCLHARKAGSEHMGGRGSARVCVWARTSDAQVCACPRAESGTGLQRGTPTRLGSRVWEERARPCAHTLRADGSARAQARSNPEGGASHPRRLRARSASP